MIGLGERPLNHFLSHLLMGSNVLGDVIEKFSGSDVSKTSRKNAFAIVGFGHNIIGFVVVVMTNIFEVVA